MYYNSHIYVQGKQIVSRSASVVEINGNRYDAATGQLVGAVKLAVTAIRPGNGQVLEGFIRRPVASHHAAKVQLKAQIPRNSLKSTAQAVHRRAQQSRTIMRDVVTKPMLKTTPKIAEPARLSKRSAIITSKRAFRAKTILKNNGVSRFSLLKSAYAKKPETAQEGEVLPRSTKIASPVQTATKALAKPLPSMVTSVSHNQLERMLDHALVRADAHKQALRGHLNSKGPLRVIKRLPRWFSAGLFVFLFLGAGGFLAWQKVPQLSLMVASSRAHISASVPSYTPYGFSLAGPVQFHDGSVQTEMKTSADKSKTLTVSQQSSSLSSESLAASFIPKNTPVQTSQVKGATVYIYGKNNNAIWVSKGIKYSIDNNAQLSSDELLKIAGGL